MMMGKIEGGCENLCYGFNYNADENTIEASFSVTSGIPYDGRIVDAWPFVQILSFGRKQEGSKPAIDRVFDNPEKAAEIAKRAELLFSKELGWAIARAMQLLVPEVLYRCGIEFKASPKRMADVLGQSYRKNIAQHLRVKRGPGKGRKTSKPSRTYSKQQLEIQIPKKIREVDAADIRPTRDAVAHALGMNNGKALYRLQRHYGDERAWPDCVSQALSK